MTSRKPPSAAFWATVVVVVALVAYPLSFGPVTWAGYRDDRVAYIARYVYCPVFQMAFQRGRARDVILWYAFWGAPKGRGIVWTRRGLILAQVPRSK
jgi:hypothetical protein